MKQDKVLSLLGLAAKAGKTASGEFSVEKAVKGRIAHLVIVAADASGNTKKKFRNMCEFYQVPIYFYGEKEKLGRAMGKEQRSSAAVLDEGLAKAAAEKLAVESE